jgi:acyl-CoA thioesterase
MLNKDTSLEEVRAFFREDRFATEACGCRVLEARQGHAVCAFDVTPVHRNAQGNVMG